MPRTRKSHPPSLKAKVAVEAIKAHKTAAQIAQMFGVHPTQVGGWKKQALAGLPDIFGNGREQMRQQSDTESFSIITGRVLGGRSLLPNKPSRVPAIEFSTINAATRGHTRSHCPLRFLKTGLFIYLTATSVASVVEISG